MTPPENPEITAAAENVRKALLAKSQADESLDLALADYTLAVQNLVILACGREPAPPKE